MAYSANQKSTGLDTLDNTSLANGDLAIVGDVSDTGRAKGITWTNIKAFLKTYFDTLYPSGSGTSTGTNTGDQDLSTYPTLTSTSTLTNKRITQRIDTVIDAATITPTGDASDEYTITALGQNATIAAPSGAPTNGQKLIIRLRDDGTGRTLTWNSIFAAIGTTLPSTTVANKYTYVGCIYNSQSSKWDVVAVTTQA